MDGKLDLSEPVFLPDVHESRVADRKKIADGLCRGECFFAWGYLRLALSRHDASYSVEGLCLDPCNPVYFFFADATVAR